VYSFDFDTYVYLIQVYAIHLFKLFHYNLFQHETTQMQILPLALGSAHRQAKEMPPLPALYHLKTRSKRMQKIDSIISQLPIETQLRYRMLCAVKGKHAFDKGLRSHLRHKIGEERREECTT